MPKFTDQTIQNIKSRLNLVDLIRRTVPNIKKKGRGYWACCPFHHEKSASFHIKEDDGYYHCFGCGAHGDGFTFVQETQGGDFGDAVQYLADFTGVRLEVEQVDPVKEKRRTDGLSALAKAAEFFRNNLAEAEPAKAYVKKRGLSAETEQTFQLGWVADQWESLKNYLIHQGFEEKTLLESGLLVEGEGQGRIYDRFRGRLMFPIQDLKDNVVGFGGRIIGEGEPKYLNSGESSFFHKSDILYNLNRARSPIKKAGRALLVEGYMDVIGLWQQGIEYAVAACGTAVTEDQIRLLWRFHSLPTVCLDGDAAGQKAAVRLAHRILPVLEAGKSLQFAYMPEGEDPDSFVKKHSRAAFEKQISQTSSLEDVLWADLTQGQDLKNADTRGAIERNLEGLLSTMKDETLKRHYRSSLKNRLWHSVRLQSGAQSGKVVPSNVRKDWVPSAKNGGATRLILALALMHPRIACTFEEKLAEINFEKQEDQGLKQELFRFLLKNSSTGVEKKDLHHHLLAKGFQDAFDALKDEALENGVIPVEEIQDETQAEGLLSRLLEETWTRQLTKQAAEQRLAEVKKSLRNEQPNT